MPQDTLSFIQKLQEYGILGYVWILIVSLWAGTARYLGNLNGGKATMMGWLTETCISGFVGVVTALVCQYYEVDPLLMYAVVGISAHNGTRSLYMLKEIIRKNTPVRIDDDTVTSRTIVSKKKERDIE